MKKKNILWIICLIMLDSSLIYLMLNGKIRYFLHPKMNKFIIFTIFILSVFVVLETYFLLKKKESLLKDHGVWIFLMPLAFLIIFQPSSLDADTLKNKANKVDLSNPKKQYKNLSYKKTDFNQYDKNSTYVPPSELKSKEKKYRIKDDRSEIEKSQERKKSQKRTQQKVNQAINDLKEKKQQISDSKHIPKVVEINPDEIEYSRLEGEKYKDLLAKAYNNTDPGKEFIISGFVFKQDDFKNNHISISRLLMTCCVADASIIGLLGDISEIENVEIGRWYEFSGTISKTKYYDNDLKEETQVPILKVSSAKAIEVPISPYVYP